MPDNQQPSLVLTRAMTLQGIFPSRDSGDGSMYLATVRTTAANFAPSGGSTTAEGQLLAISQNTALFSLIGTLYGGNGQTTFALPDLDGRLSVGGYLEAGAYSQGVPLGNDLLEIAQSNLPPGSGGVSSAIGNEQESLPIRYAINYTGVFPSSGGNVNMVGVVQQFAGSFAPGGTIECDGRLLPIAEYETLFAVIGTLYGGDGVTTFAVPDLVGRTVVGAGNGYNVGDVLGSADATITPANLPVEMGGLGLPIDNRGPSLVMNQLIATQGIYPSQDGGWDPQAVHVAEIVTFAGTVIPNGYAPAQGQLLSIAQNTALFSLLGTNYGGNGQTTFALPNLMGRAVVGSGDEYVGTLLGAEQITLTLDDFPALSFSGNAGDDALYGANQADTISGLDGNDTITGNGGGDLLDGGTGTDTMSGGLGDDWFYVDSSTDVVNETAGQGTDRVFTSASYVLGAGVAVETLSTTATLATTAIALVGNELANNIYGNYGNNSLFGSGGNDTLVGHDGDDTLNGGTGTDAMNGGLGNDSFYVDAAGDTVGEVAGQGADRVFAGASYTLAAGVSVETLSTDNTAGTTAINLAGNEIVNNVYGNNGNNALYGGGGNDTLIGHEGDDTLNGSIGTDTMSGGLGNDWFYVNTSTDTVSEAAGQGTDRIFTSSNYVLGAGVSIETLSTDNVAGTTTITLIGNEFANNVYGNYGNNSLFGSSGNDTLIAHAGNDLLNGGAGADSLIGGVGTDTFVFANAAGAGNVDAIGDYAVADDVIHIDNAIFIGLAAGALAAGAFRTGAAAADADDRVIYNSATGALFFDADGNGAGAAVQFATLATGLAMTAGEFLVI